MKGLFLKDCYCAVKCCKSSFGIDIVFLVIAIFANGNPFFLMFPCITAGLLAMTLIAYDEHDGWDKYAATLPYTKAQIVSSKYLLGLLYIFAVGTLAAIAQAYAMIRLGAFALDVYACTVMLLYSIGLASSAMFCPFLYKFGVTKGRIVYYFLIGAGCALSTILSLDDVKPSYSLSGAWTAACIIIAAALLYGLSWKLSIRFYERREL